MERVIRKSLEDILQSIDEINGFFENRERRFDVFVRDVCLRRAVQMDIAIIGEAMNRILKLEPNIPITAARRIVNTRNYMIHGYDSLNYETMWGIVMRHLPALESEILSLIGNTDDDE